MDARIKELVDFTKDQWGLSEYYLGRHRLFRRLMLDGETLYFLNMEWFPNIYADWTDEEENPEGAASIDINIHSKEFHSAIFVQGLTYAENGVIFLNKDINEIKDWLTDFTGLNIEKDFVCQQTDEREFYFQEQWNGIPLSPSCSINVEFNENGELTFYSKNVSVLSKKKDLQDAFTLSLFSIGDIAKEQVVLAKFPEADGTMIVYGVEETYIRNDRNGSLPFMQEHGACRKNVNKILGWEEVREDTFERAYIQWGNVVSIDQAYLMEPDPDSLPITDEEVEKSIQAVIAFLQMKYPNDSGKWTLTYLSRENSYLHAYLEQNTAPTLFPGKLIVFLDTEGKVVNYMDKKELWDNLDVKEDEAIEMKVSKEEAFEKLQPYCTLTPYYVYDAHDKNWVLCGKLDCDYFVDVESGEVSKLGASFFIN
ncbi:hypothetical protein AB3U99_04460 [Niallia sp. JL1B1071]|uniref:hypothetical protein n=1 Tax=Niallia tiangongensis TaxID=3237105 RepID=UPI0037DDBF39